MRANLRPYRPLRDALIQVDPGKPTGWRVRHVTTWAAVMSGLVASKRTPLPHIATQVPEGQKPESRVTRFARWLDNERIVAARYFVSSAESVLTHCA